MKNFLAIILIGLPSFTWSQVPAFNNELGLKPQLKNYTCTVSSLEQADILIMMLINKSNFHWARNNCGSNLLDVKDYEKKVVAQDKYLDRSIKGCYSESDARTIQEIVSLSIMPGTTCKSNSIVDSVNMYKKSLEISSRQ
jgi:hypothetical protein